MGILEGPLSFPWPGSPATNRVRLAAWVSLVLLLGSATCGQEPTAQKKDQTPSSTTRSNTAIKTKVRQVLLDVVVTDGKNHPLTGLGQKDFSVFEDHRPQTILSFEAHSASSETTPPASQPLPLPPNTFANGPPPLENPSLNVILYDLLNTPIVDQPFAHQEVVKFLKHRPSGSWFAIFVLSDKLRLLQGFTDDERLLLAAVSQKTTGPYFSSELDHSESQVDTSALLPNSPMARADQETQRMIEGVEAMEAVSRRYFLGRRVERTLEAFREIGNFVKGLPGRKNLIWLSGSFPEVMFPGSDPLEDGASPAIYSDDIRRASDLLTVGQVAVYPVDIKGLTTDPIFAGEIAGYRSPFEFLRAHRNFIDELFAEQIVMDEIAENTGGHAFYNTNGLAAAIATSVQDGANYYTLSYSPSNTHFDGGLRKIKVEVAWKGAHLAYRRSYLADDDNTLAEKRAAAEPELLQTALRRGNPLARELPLRVHVTALGSPRPVKKDEIKTLSMFPRFAAQRDWSSVRVQRYSAEYTLPELPRSSKDVTAGDNARFEFLFAAYDADETIVCGERLPVYEARSVTAARDTPLRLRQLIAIPTDAAWLRLAVRDLVANRIGSVEIPLPLSPETPEERRSR